MSVIAGSCSCMSSFITNCLSAKLCWFSIPPTVCESSSCPLLTVMLGVICLLIVSRSGECGAVFHCGLSLRFCDDYDGEHLFLRVIGKGWGPCFWHMDINSIITCWTDYPFCIKLSCCLCQIFKWIIGIDQFLDSVLFCLSIHVSILVQIK